MEWMILIGKALLGTSLFLGILWCMQSLDPRAAGMLLTFPALNGIGLLLGESRDLYVMASAMLPMIATNGLLCAAYVLLYCRWAADASATVRRGKAALIAVGCISLWGLVAYGLAPWLQTWVKTPSRMALFGAVYGVGIWPLTPRLGTPGHPPRLSERQGGGGILRTNAGKIVGMFGLILLVLLVARDGADAWAGRLSTLPLLPLYSLVLLSTTEAHPNHRPARLEQLGSTILFGPLIAMAFVWSFTQYLMLLRQHAPVLYGVAGACGLLGLWGSCGLLILAGVRWRHWQERRMHRRQALLWQEPR